MIYIVFCWKILYSSFILIIWEFCKTCNNKVKNILFTNGNEHKIGKLVLRQEGEKEKFLS